MKIKRVILLDKEPEVVIEEKDYRIPNELQLEVREVILTTLNMKGKN